MDKPEEMTASFCTQSFLKRTVTATAITISAILAVTNSRLKSLKHTLAKQYSWLLAFWGQLILILKWELTGAVVGNKW